jgi:hypothetical protein
MVKGLHALTPIEFIQELLMRVGEANYMVEEACADFIDSYIAESNEGKVDFLACTRYISGRIPISMVDTSVDILVDVDLYGCPTFLGDDGEYHDWEDEKYSSDDESKFEAQEADRLKGSGV